MKTKRFGKAEAVAFDALEPRLLLDGGMWSAVGAVDGAPAGEVAAAAEAVQVAVDGDGVPDERGADVDNDGRWPDGEGPLLEAGTDAMSADADGDGKLGLNDVKTSAGEGGAQSLVIAYEPVWAIGTGKAKDSAAPATDSPAPDAVDVLAAEPALTIVATDGPHTDSSDPTPVFLTPENNPLTQMDGGSNSDDIVFLTPENNPLS